MKSHEPPGIPGGGENTQAWRHDEIAAVFAGLDVTAAHAQADRFALLALCFADGLLTFERAISVAAESAWSGAGASAAAHAVTAYVCQARQLVAALDELPAVVRAAAEAVVSTKYAIPAVVSDAGEPAWAAGRSEPHRAASTAQDEARTAMHDRYVVPFGELSGRIPVLPTPTRVDPGESAVSRSDDPRSATGRPRDAELYGDTSAATESTTKADSKLDDVVPTDASAGGVADVARSGTTDAVSRPDISATSSPEPSAPEESSAMATAAAATDPTTASTATEGSTASTATEVPTTASTPGATTDTTATADPTAASPATDGPTTDDPTNTGAATSGASNADAATSGAGNSDAATSGAANADAATSGAANADAATSGAAISGAPPDRNAVAAPASAATTSGAAGNPAVASTGYSGSGGPTSGPFTGGLPAGSGGWSTGVGSAGGWSAAAAAPAPGDAGTSIARGAAAEARPAYLGYGVRHGGDGGEATATASGAGGRPGASSRVELPGQPAPGQPGPVRLGGGQSVAGAGGAVIGGETPPASGSAGPRTGDRHVHCPLGVGAAVAPGDDGARRVPEYLITRGNTEALLGTPRPAIAGGVIGGDATPDEQQQAATRDRLSCR